MTIMTESRRCDEPVTLGEPDDGRLRARTPGWRQSRRFILSSLSWNRLYRVTSYLKSALWTVPLIAIVIELATLPLLRALDDWLDWRLSGLGLPARRRCTRRSSR